MTLTKAIEAARDKIREKILNAVFWMKHDGVHNEAYYQGKRDAFDECQGIWLAALPDAPKSEDEIAKIIKDAWIDESNHGYPFRRDMNVLRALKAANVLFVKED